MKNTLGIGLCESWDHSAHASQHIQLSSAPSSTYPEHDPTQHEKHEKEWRAVETKWVAMGSRVDETPPLAAFMRVRLKIPDEGAEGGNTA
jgi:hypothetical protein